jgi:hypothetical protein
MIVLIVTPIPEQVLPESIAGRRFQKPGRDDLVCIHVLDWQGNTGGTEGIEFLD